MSGISALLEREQRAYEEAPEELKLCEAQTFAVPQTLREAILSRARDRGIEQPDKTELVQIIRPGIGQGRGRRYYGPQMLESNHGVFRGSRMFVNHETEKQRREREGLPRKVEDLGGRIVETWWDGDVPADGRFEQGGVYGFMRVLPKVGEIIEADPELLETSISALATAASPGRHRGQPCSIVEGIRATPRPSVDFIAGDGGAGGRVLLEAADEEVAVLEGLSDQEIESWLAEERPGLLEALHERHDGGGGGHSTEETNMEITEEVLSEALASSQGQAAIAAAVREALTGFEPGIPRHEVESLVEAELAERADLLRVEQTAAFERQIELRDMERRAHQLIQEAKLHPILAGQLTERFSLTESGTPTADLDVAPELDDNDNVARPAMEVLTEAVTEEIGKARKLQADLRPTGVRGQGGRVLIEADGGNGELPKKLENSTGSTVADEVLKEAGIPAERLGDLWATA